jgi:hypothetical protein
MAGAVGITMRTMTPLALAAPVEPEVAVAVMKPAAVLAEAVMAPSRYGALPIPATRLQYSG